MSAFSDRYKSEDPQLSTAIKALDFMVDVCPSVRDIFQGVFNEAGEMIVKGGSILIFCDGNRLKFVVNLASTKEKGWGIIVEPRNIWDSLELAIVRGDVDWRIAENSPSESTPY